VDAYRIEVPDSAIADLRDRLGRTRWPLDPASLGWDRGAPLHHVRALAERWRDGYDWRAWEARLNAWPQVMTEIDGTPIHAAHVRSPEPEALPLVLSHGWPGSIAEFLDVAGPLSDPRAHGGDPADAFHLVLPSIPGYGFSGPTLEPGWDVRRVALAWDELMARLGYQRYGAQGGDWGSSISRELGVSAPEHIIGVHLNMLLPQGASDQPDLTDVERGRLDRMRQFRNTGMGYGAIQSTRPQTLAYALTDSPAGQLAWIVEKFREWTDGDLPDDAVDRDQMLTNVTLYWLTGTAGSSARLYFEAARSGVWGPPAPSTAPTGVAVFPYEIAPPIRRFAEMSNNIVHWSEFDRGGHFAAMEEPDLLVADVRQFFRQLR